VFMGAFDGVSGLTLSRTDNILNGRINNNQLLSGAISPTGTTLFSVSRTGKNDAVLYCGNEVVERNQVSSLNLINSSVSIGRAQEASGWYTSANICAAFAGAGLSETEMFALNDALQRYIHSFRQTVASGAWVQTPFSLLSPDSVESISSGIVDRKTTLLSNAIIAYDQYGDIARTKADSTGIRALDESTGVIYEPSDIPDAVLSETTAFIARMTTIPDAVQQVAL
ncbi:hypothetical protein, partial [Klebsiella michiganensis]|uniref:hypothetical protein n=1 Tax=Klebsiella michiganensis TaxID=1134687 RepID=UPI003984366F